MGSVHDWLCMQLCVGLVDQGPSIRPDKALISSATRYYHVQVQVLSMPTYGISSACNYVKNATSRWAAVAFCQKHQAIACSTLVVLAVETPMLFYAVSVGAVTAWHPKELM